MIDDHDLVVRTVREGPICTLAVGGGLDMIAADRFLADVTRALDSRTERLVFDLADLTFLDCSGARNRRWVSREKQVLAHAAR